MHKCDVLVQSHEVTRKVMDRRQLGFDMIHQTVFTKGNHIGLRA